MMGTITNMWQANPQFQGYLARNPKGSLAQALARGGGPPSFAEGGMIGDDGQPVRPGQPVSPPVVDNGPPMGEPEMDGPQIEQEANRIATQHPDVMQNIQAAIAQAIQSGELTPDELNMAIQLAKAALANPNAYPQIRQFAIKNGIGTEQDIPQQMDRGMLLALIVAGKALGNGGQGAAPQSGMEADSGGKALPAYKNGGMTKDKEHLAVLHGKEYVIPADVVLYHGKKNLDKLVEQARTPPDAKSGS